MYWSEVKFLALVILLVLFFVTAVSSGRVTRISERFSGINPAATRGRGEYLWGDVTGVAVTRYVTPGDGDDTATDAGGDVTNDDGGQTMPRNVIEGKNTPKDVAGGTEDVAGGTEDVAGDTEDVAGGSENVTGGSEDVAGGSEDVAGGTEDVARGTEDVTGDTEDIAGDNITPTHAIADDFCEDDTTAEDMTAGKVTEKDKIPTTESEIDGILGSTRVLLLVGNGEQDREHDPELDNVSVDTLELGPADRDV